MLERSRYDGVLFVLEELLVRSAELHASAWKEAFDEFLAERAAGTARTPEPFLPARDYVLHVRGNPTEVAAERLLAARRLTLPLGRPGDGPHAATVFGLANRVHRQRLARLRAGSLQVNEAALQFAETLHRSGFRLAAVSLDRHAEELLRAAELAKLFHAWVDGRDVARLHLAVPPAPDLWVEALRRLEVSPQRAAAFVTGAEQVSGARSAGVATVWDAQADASIFDAFGVVFAATSRPGTAAVLPSALVHVDTIAQAGRPTALFLDFDGTLTGITGTPQEASMSDAVRDTVAAIASRGVPVAVVSGRDLDNLQARVGLSTLYYAGSHGFDIAGPEGLRYEHPEGLAQLPALDAAERFLREQLGDLTGALVERKRFALAAHYRLVAPARVQRVEEAVTAALAMFKGLRASRGKKVIELLPAVEWHKGRAMLWLLERMAPGAWPVYVGDDQTDEDAFALLRDHGTGIAVQEHPSPTAARFRLAGPHEVALFLDQLAEKQR